MNVQISLEDKDALFSYFPRGLVALDLETTGLSPFQHKIIEVGAVKMDHREELEHFNELVDPQSPIPPFTTTIHHITDDMVRGKPLIQDVLPRLVKFCGDLPILAHNASFDLGFIIFHLSQHNLPLPQWEIFDSCKMSRKMFKDYPNHKLATLSQMMKIPNLNQHRAFDDALTAFLVFARTLRQAKDRKLSPELIYKQAALFRLSDFRRRSTEKIPANLDALVERIGLNEIVEISYNGGSMREGARPIIPVSFLPMPKGTVLHALCILSGVYKSFSVQKIISVKVLDEASRKRWEEEIARRKVSTAADAEDNLPQE